MKITIEMIDNGRVVKQAEIDNILSIDYNRDTFLYVWREIHPLRVERIRIKLNSHIRVILTE